MCAAARRCRSCPATCCGAAAARHRRARAVPRRQDRHPGQALFRDAPPASAAHDGSARFPSAIERERELLAELADLGHHIDTSDLSPNALRAWVKDLVDLGETGLTLLFQSFGFKHGIPLDADMVFDVRCLPNPHYDPVLRPAHRTRHRRDRVPRSGRRRAEDAGRHPPLRREMAAVLRARQPQLSHRRDRLHRRPAPLGLFRRDIWRRISAASRGVLSGTANCPREYFRIRRCGAGSRSTPRPGIFAAGKSAR